MSISDTAVRNVRRGQETPKWGSCVLRSSQERAWAARLDRHRGGLCAKGWEAWVFHQAQRIAHCGLERSYGSRPAARGRGRTD